MNGVHAMKTFKVFFETGYRDGPKFIYTRIIVRCFSLTRDLYSPDDTLIADGKSILLPGRIATIEEE